MIVMGMLPDRKVIPLRRRAKHARHAPWRTAFDRLEARVAELERGMHALDRRMVALGKHGRLKVAASVSVFLHAIIIFGVSFVLPDPAKFSAPPPLEVTLVNAKTQARPQKPDALAQANLDGGGNTDARRRARSPLPVPAEDKQGAKLTLAQKRVEQREREAKQLMTQTRSPTAVPPRLEAQKQQDEPEIAPSATDIISRGMEFARL